jgi:hypothetical protein
MMVLTKEERSKSAKRAKGRGGNFQREIAKVFSQWWDNKDEEFYSTPASGGLRWQKRDDVIGDLVVPTSFIFNVECKSREEIGMGILFERKYNKTDGIHLWWNQILSDTQRSGKKPMLVFKQLRQYPIVCIKSVELENLCPSSDILDEVTRMTVVTTIPCLTGYERVVLMKLSDFTEYIKPDNCKLIHNGS